MQIKARDQRDRIANERAHPGQQFAFGIVGMLGHRSAVQVEIDRIHAPVALRCGQIFQDGSADALKGVARDIRRRRGARPRRRNQRPAMARGRMGKAADRNVDVAQLVEHRLAAHEGRKAVATGEGGPVGQAWGKGIGFVLEASDKNSHE